MLYLPLLVVLFLWRRVSEPSRLPRERLNRAIVSGVRYIANSPSIRIVLARTLVTGIIGGSVSALMPLVARDLLHGGAQTYGIMLGAFGMGAVIGALNIAEVRKRLERRGRDPRLRAVDGRARSSAVALSHEPVLTAAALVRRRRGMDAGGRAVQYRRPAVRAALGRGPLARGLPGLDRRRHRDRQLGLGPSHRRGRRRNRAAGLRRH